MMSVTTDQPKDWEVLNDPAIQVGLVVTNRDRSTIILVRPNYDWARNHDAAEKIAAALNKELTPTEPLVPPDRRNF
jgi:hypothetical protein